MGCVAAIEKQVHCCGCAGAAIAAAVLDHLAHNTRCCGLFATHYHQLAAEHAADPQVAIMHMACAVAEQPDQPEQQQQQDDAEEAGSRSAAGDGGVAEVTFLYKLTAGEADCIAGCWQTHWLYGIALYDV
jgi:DNA mismatch repair ATPase MutS